MSTVFVLIVVLGLLGAATFLIGFSKGVREAVREYRNPQPEGAWSDEGHYGLSALFAVVASAVVISNSRNPSTSQSRQFRLCGPMLLRGEANASRTHG